MRSQTKCAEEKKNRFCGRWKKQHARTKAGRHVDVPAVRARRKTRFLNGVHRLKRKMYL